MCITSQSDCVKEKFTCFGGLNKDLAETDFGDSEDGQFFRTTDLIPQHLNPVLYE